ncbi:unnamed protein product [Candidula unifasciata]|uniref:Transmembrane protein n=1 Tax=Candidula unifasciata TaxID=100452 RepID=A0A8S3YSM2_9EUPU|nr:unnamed protein product [Candidula unifasciata]
MPFGHCLFLVCYVFCITHAASVKGTEPKDVPESSIDDVATKLDLAETNATFIIPAYQDTGHTKGSELPRDSVVSNLTDALGNANVSSIDMSGKNINDTSNKTDDLVGISYTERSAGRRLGLSRYKSGRQQVSIGDLTISDHAPRHGALLHKNDKIDTLAVKEESAVGDGDNMAKRKRRIPSSSATPSFQIVILVVGAVVGCLLLTGFVRWRVRGRLNAKKNAKIADDYVYGDGRVYKGSTEMSTIYECEFEESQSMLRLSESLDVDMNDFQDDHGTKFGDNYGSQKFNMPLSATARAYHTKHSGRQAQPRSPKSGRHFRLVPGSKRSSMNRHKYGNKNRYSKHLKRRLENMFVQTLETIPMENSTFAAEHWDSFSSELGNKHGIRNVSSEHLAATSLQQPIPIKHGSPTFRRGAFASILNTWRSLSFNRDWVGKMWQEQHNIRRLSDILRGRRESSSSSSSSSKDSDAQSSRLSSSRESLSSASSFGSFFKRRGNSITDRDTPVFDFFGRNTASGKAYEQNGRLFAITDASETAASSVSEHKSNSSSSAGFTTDTTTPATSCPEAPKHDPFISCHSYSDLFEEPAECESLLSNSLHSSTVSARKFDEHPRYQRIHQRKRVEGRKRANSFNGSTPISDRFCPYGNMFSQDDSLQSFNSSHSQVHADFDLSDTKLDHMEEHNGNHTSCPNDSSCSFVSSSVSQKRSVADEHLNGAGTERTTFKLRGADHSDTKKPYLA